MVKQSFILSLLKELTPSKKHSVLLLQDSPNIVPKGYLELHTFVLYPGNSTYGLVEFNQNDIQRFIWFFNKNKSRYKLQAKSFVSLAHLAAYVLTYDTEIQWGKKLRKNQHYEASIKRPLLELVIQIFGLLGLPFAIIALMTKGGNVASIVMASILFTINFLLMLWGIYLKNKDS